MWIKSMRQLWVLGLISIVWLFMLPMPVKGALGKINQIVVKGNVRLDSQFVLSKIPVQVGQAFDPSLSEQILQGLYETGMFEDVTLEMSEGGRLQVQVVERPVISAVRFNGVKRHQEPEFKHFLREVGFFEGRVFSPVLLEKVLRQLKDLYVAQGQYGAVVTSRVLPLERQRVVVVIDVQAHHIAKVKKITIANAKAFPKEKLVRLLELDEGGLFSWYTKRNHYTQDKLDQSLEKLRAYYLDHGFLKFKVESLQVTMSPDEADVFIYVSLYEGAPYTVSSVRLSSGVSDIVPTHVLQDLLSGLQVGEVFNRQEVFSVTEAFSQALSREGFALSSVDVSPEIDETAKTVALTFQVNPGKRVYVRRINIAGNTQTSDHVIRRELRQLEGSWYDGELVERSRDRIDLLGFFSAVSVETVPVIGQSDQVDLDILVVEESTGSLQMGVGYSSTENLVLNASVAQNNFLGTGNALSLNFDTSKSNRSYYLSYNMPYFTKEGAGLGLDLYRRNYSPDSNVVSNYESRNAGGAAQLSFPVGEFQRLSYGLAYEDIRLTLFDDSPDQFQQFVSNFGHRSRLLLSSWGWKQDRRDSAFYATQGYIQQLGLEVTIPVDNIKFYRSSYRASRYFNLSEENKIVLKLSGDLGYAHGFGSSPVPFFKNYYAGGVGSVRGYSASSLGPKNSFNEALGGQKKIVGSVEVLLPMPGLRDSKSVRVGGFVDAGQVFGSGDYLGRFNKVRLDELKYSAGISLFWLSPLGPLSFSYGVPLNESASDTRQSFQFSIGSVL